MCSFRASNHMRFWTMLRNRVLKGWLLVVFFVNRELECWFAVCERIVACIGLLCPFSNLDLVPTLYIYSFIRGCSSVGRVRRSQCRGQGFDPPQLQIVLRLDRKRRKLLFYHNKKTLNYEVTLQNLFQTSSRGYS